MLCYNMCVRVNKLIDSYFNVTRYFMCNKLMNQTITSSIIKIDLICISTSQHKISNDTLVIVNKSQTLKSYLTLCM